MLFEQIIKLAEEHPADDTIWSIKDELSDEGISEAYFTIAEKYVPLVKSFREIAKANMRFRVRDRRQDSNEKAELDLR